MKGALITLACALPALALAAAGCYCVYVEYGVAQMLAYLLLCALFFPLASLLHELGHIICGKLCGMRVKLVKNGVFRPSGCNVLPERPGNMRARFVFTALGGLIVNFVFAVVGMGLLFADGVALYFSFFAPASFYLFMINVLPVTYASGDTDMLLALQAIKNTDVWKVLGRVLEIQGMITAGTPIEGIEEDLFFSVPQIAEYEPAFIMLVSLRADYYAARGDEENAKKWGDRLESINSDI